MNSTQCFLRLKEAWGRMTNYCGQKRYEGALGDLQVTKRAKGLSTSSEGSEDLAYFRRENEDLKRQLQSVQDTLHQLQIVKDCRFNGKKDRDGEIFTLNPATQSLPADFTQENDKQMLVAKLQLCQSELNDKDLQIERLEKNAVEAKVVRLELVARMGKMQQQLCKELEGCGSYADGAATPFLLESLLKVVQTSAASFTKAFFDYSRKHTLDLSCALTKHFHDTYLTRQGHVTYLLKAWVFETLFQDFENESFSCGGASVFLDQAERRLKFFEYFQHLESSVFDLGLADRFEQFRRQKLGDILSLWQSSDQVTAGNLSIDALENPGAEEVEVRLMESFRSVAKGVWTLHKLSLSFQTRAEIFRVRQEDELNAEYMDSVVSVQDDEQFVSKVGFMICPGFRLKRSVLKCQIYLAGQVVKPQELS